MDSYNINTRLFETDAASVPDPTWIAGAYDTEHFTLDEHMTMTPSPRVPVPKKKYQPAARHTRTGAKLSPNAAPPPPRSPDKPRFQRLAKKQCLRKPAEQSGVTGLDFTWSGPPLSPLAGADSTRVILNSQQVAHNDPDGSSPSPSLEPMSDNDHTGALSCPFLSQPVRSGVRIARVS